MGSVVRPSEYLPFSLDAGLPPLQVTHDKTRYNFRPLLSQLPDRRPSVAPMAARPKHNRAM